MVKSKTKTKKRIYINLSKSKKYKPLNLSIIEFRKKHNNKQKQCIDFLNTNPTEEQINKLYDTTFYFAESDSIGEMWSYVQSFTRQQFNILCKIIKHNAIELINKEYNKKLNIIYKQIETKYKLNKNDKNYSNLMQKYISILKKENNYPNYLTIEEEYLINNNILTKEEYSLDRGMPLWQSDYITIAYDLLNHLKVL